ncbi:MAG: YidC/Oxa1 family membrane protein insertase [Candidatus Margulisiibacteriota bacterium]
MNIFIDITLKTLDFFYAVGFHNYGIAIILLTIAIKVALYPLTLQSTRQMSAMQKLQPKFDELKKKHKETPDKFQKETMELYKKHGVNPLGGCLPLLIQMPVFIALFMALTSQNFKSMLEANPAAAQFLWIDNISLPDKIHILNTGFYIPLLALLIGITTYWSQKTMPQAGGQDQMKQMMMIMPFFIAFISIEFAAGVQIYWVVQNLLTVAQQMYIVSKHGKV